MSKRYRRVEAKPGELLVRYGRGEDSTVDLQYAWGGKGAQSPDARCVSNAFEGVAVHDGKTLREVLTERGYDMDTFRFSISLLPPQPNPIKQEKTDE